MKNSVKTGRSGRQAVGDILRQHRHKAMLRYLEYLKSDTRLITEEERHVYRPPLRQWWLGNPKTDKKKPA